MRVVAEVPSIEMECMYLRRNFGISCRRKNSVAFHELAQSIVSSLFLDDKDIKMIMNY